MCHAQYGIGYDLVDTRASILAQEEMIRGDRYRFVRNAFLCRTVSSSAGMAIVEDSF